MLRSRDNQAENGPPEVIEFNATVLSRSFVPGQPRDTPEEEGCGGSDEGKRLRALATWLSAAAHDRSLATGTPARGLYSHWNGRSQLRVESRHQKTVTDTATETPLRNDNAKQERHAPASAGGRGPEEAGA